MSVDEFATEAEAAIAAALAKRLPVTGRAIIRHSQTLVRAERLVPIQRARVKECRYCGITFQGRTRRAQFCSDDCRRADWREKRRSLAAPSTCPECGSSFAAAHSNSKYCSTTCRETGRVRRQRQARATRRRATLQGG